MGLPTLPKLPRRFGTTRDSRPFTPETVAAVWLKARQIPGVDNTVSRMDACGARIDLLLYGKTVDFGWEIDHIIPVAKGGGDDLGNLQPLQWQNNRYKSDSDPSIPYCIVTR